MKFTAQELEAQAKKRLNKAMTAYKHNPTPENFKVMNDSINAERALLWLEPLPAEENLKDLV